MLNKRELSFVQPHRTSLVLSASERQLLADSERELGEKHHRLRAGLIAAGMMLVVGAGLSLFWMHSLQEPLPVEKSIQLMNATLAPEVQRASQAPYAPAGPALRERVNVAPAASQAHRSTAEKRGAGDPASTPAENAARATAATGRSGEGPGFALGSFPIVEQEAPVEEAAPELPPEEEAPEERKARFSEIHPVRTGEGVVHIVLYNGRWALATPLERFLLLPEYDRIEAYDGGQDLFLIEKAGKQGLATADGTVILHPFYEHVKAYYREEALFVVANGGKFGVYDGAKDSFAVGLTYSGICCFSEGLFGVRAEDGKWGFVDRSGELVIPPAYDAIEAGFDQGRAVVRQGADKLTIDASGAAVVIR